MRFAKALPLKTALLFFAVGALLALGAAPTASAQATTASASAQRAAAICAKRAQRIAPRAASTSAAAQRRRATRRCVASLLRSTARRSKDTAAPSIAWTAPTAGATVSGKVDGPACEAGASDDRGVAKVTFQADGATLNTEAYAPYNCVFDTAKLGDGTHTLTATAYDAAGNSRSASVTVTVANKVAPAPAPTPAPEAEPEPTPAPAPSPSGDAAAPTVSWRAPATGASLSGNVQGTACEASAGDDRGVERVVMKVDGAVLNTEVAAPYNCYFDTTKVADGSHALTATAYDADGNSRSSTTTVNVSNAPAPVPPPAPAPAPSPAPGTGSLVVGIDGGYGGWSSTETTYRAQLGAAVTRHEWDPAAPVNAQDALVLKAAAQVHTRIHALLGGNSLGNATSYREWVIAFIHRYGAGGSFWAEHPELDESRYAMTTFELGNEPYFGAMSASLYADTVRPTLEEVKRLGLPAKIVLASRVYGTDTSWMDTLYQRVPNLNNLFYAFADHPYWYAHDPAQVSAAGPFGRIDVLRRRMNEKGAAAKPILLTEYGESTANCGGECVSEAVQAEHLQKMLNAAITRSEWKIEMVSFFQLLDRGTSSSDRELQFGLLRQNGTEKPSYSIVRGGMQQYRG
jgi:hypothetical protein